MTWLQANNAVEQLSQNVILYDLGQMRDNSSVLKRIPHNVSGIYAWYRGFHLDPATRDNPEVFVNFLLSELSKAHSVARETKLPPAHKILLQPETSFHKEILLRQLAKEPSFRQLLFTLLNNSLIFQQPLYIGKAINIYFRIRTHLAEGSILRERLSHAGHNINKCRLLLIFTPNNLPNSTISYEQEEQEDDVTEESEISQLESEVLVEDILSRLFLPSFTLRYG
ncbi:hypothetical protein [Merismopedia glauca]|uniref:GIY-YIG domain-containing protein n=1 Tax=Merismopedia glauca CCAP 1448/3 TaxID=1296344 RepID=A0A2T1C2L9_9CYAN|nr:hypothetical protein [Merismopedia glauca]PSB02516.1 hypothetical protein C7B64_12695 [Merismopedia glauca CCAP 1448/3]